jgi:hypothetical protein
MNTTIAPAVPAPPDAQPVERRRQPRMDLIGELQAELSPAGTQLLVLDISETGFSVESPVEFTPLQDYRLRFATSRRSHGILHAINIHCLHAMMANRQVYFAGFQFASASDAVAIRAMLTEVEEIRKASHV